MVLTIHMNSLSEEQHWHLLCVTREPHPVPAAPALGDDPAGKRNAVPELGGEEEVTSATPDHIQAGGILGILFLLQTIFSF